MKGFSTLFLVAIIMASTLLLPCVDAFVALGRQQQATTTNRLFMAASSSSTIDNRMVEKTTKKQTVTAGNNNKIDNPNNKDSQPMDENSKFVCDEYVEYWKNFESPTAEEAPERIRDIVVPHLLNGTTQARAYWMYHMMRSGYFTGNAMAGALAHTLHERVIRRSDQIAPVFANSDNNDLFARYGLLLAEAFISYDQNWKWVEQGILNYPWDATLQVSSSKRDNIQLQWDHKQANPFFALSETSRLVREAIGIWGRRVRLEGKPAGVWLQDGGATGNSNIDIQYPSYYLNDFHYQTDGWLSSESAENYEVSTESLFLGRQDSMQRQTLVPLKKHFAQGNGAPPKKILEVACGTGRFATFTRDEFPTADMTLVDLSPFYLAKARDNIKYWQGYRGATAMQLATGKKGQRAPETTKFVQANAEKLPFADNSFDAVTTVYLFHEMPHYARVNAARELARVCKPGGMVVFSDSTQLHDRPDLADNLPNFGLLNEPHYESYLQEDIPALFEGHGLKCSEKYFNSRTKTLSFVKE